MADQPNIRIAILDDHQIVIDGLLAALKGYPRLTPVCTANTGYEMLEQLEHYPVDVLLTDVMMPEYSGQQLAREVRARFPSIRIIALSMSGNGSIVEEMINDADICGYLLKQSTISELATAIAKVHEGGIYFQDAILDELKKQSGIREEVTRTHLTQRERQIIELMEKDLSNKQISDTLEIAVRTVETHRKNIFRKTGTNNLLSLVKWAYEHGVLVRSS
ncbi:MAG: response regulator transcription factor [Sphingobacteriales bacterium]|nr:MAG: response regulator transcription factor [Sphingobacteriales bacterium]